jgi:copper resistance protein D
LIEPLAYVRTIHFTATVMAAGIVLCRFFVAEPAFALAEGEQSLAIARLPARWSRMVWAGLAVAALSGAAWLALLARDIYDAPISEVWSNGGVWTVATQSRFGQISLVRLGLAVLIALSSVRPIGGGERAPSGFAAAGFVAVVLAAAFLILPAWSGHAGAIPGLAGQFGAAADALHLLAAGAWIGGLLPLAMLLAAARGAKEPSRTAFVTAAVRRFSLLGMACVATLIATGAINTWYQVGSIDGLTQTTYGRLVLLKIGLFVAMVAIATINRFHLTPLLAAAAAVDRLQRNCAAEIALGLAAVFVVGFLGTMAPASHAHHYADTAAIPADAAFVHIHSTQGMAEVTITPGRTGMARASIRLFNDDFGPLEAKKVTLTLTAPAMGSRPMTRAALLGTDGAWQVEAIELSQPGGWMVEVDVVLGPASRLSLAAPIVIEAAR